MDCVLACFIGKVAEMRFFFFVGKISFVYGCDCSTYVSVVGEVENVIKPLAKSV